MVIAKLVFLEMEIEQKTPKYIIENFHEILYRSYKTIARKAVVSKNTVSWIIILYKEVIMNGNKVVEEK